MANEKRLIDANALVETIVNTPSEVAQFHTYNVLSSLAERQHEILNTIDEQPTVDAVEVVRCKDCKHFTDRGNEYTWCDWWGVVPYKDDFCSNGERMSE